MPATADLPPEIEVDSPHGVGVRYRFPRRRFAGQRVLAITLMLFGLAALVFMAFWTCGFAGGFQRLFGPLGLLSGLVAIPGFVGFSSVMGLGVAILYGHTEIEVTDGAVRTIERVGPLRWTRRRAAADIRRLVVEQGNPQRVSMPLGSVRSKSNLDFQVLRAELASGKSFWLTFAYPPEWLLAVAKRLAVDCDAAHDEPGEPGTAVEVVAESEGEPGEVDRWNQPEGSKVAYQPLPSGLTLNVPARGIRRGSAGLFSFSLLWLGFMTLFTSATVAAFFGGQGQADGALVFAVMIPLFWAVGLGMLAAAVHMGRRRAGLAVVDSQLMLLQKGPFGSKTREWELTEIQTVRVGPSGMEVNDKPVLELQIVPHEGKPFGMLGGRDVAELEWIATLLRGAVHGVADSEDQKNDAAK